jgi:L-arabinonolactonase
MIEIEHLCHSQDGLGETPIWVEEEKSLYWSDHVGPSIDPSDKRRPMVKRIHWLTRELTVWEMPEQIGSFGFRKQGGIIAGTNSGFCAIDLENAGFEKLVDPEPDRPYNRLNDGKVDRRGRYWCGSMDTRLKEKTAYIYRLNPDLTCQRMAEDFSFVCSNGIAFDPEDTRMYFGDTKGGMIYVFDFDIEEGRISNRREFFSVANHGPAIVDGATVDADGYYWFALNLGGKILRVDPKGRLDREIDMPVRTPTCVTFGGDNDETLFVTSQQTFLMPGELERFPHTGDLFAIHGLGVRGLPEPRFAG